MSCFRKVIEKLVEEKQMVVVDAYEWKLSSKDIDSRIALVHKNLESLRVYQLVWHVWKPEFASKNTGSRVASEVMAFVCTVLPTFALASSWDADSGVVQTLAVARDRHGLCEIVRTMALATEAAYGSGCQLAFCQAAADIESRFRDVKHKRESWSHRWFIVSLHRGLSPAKVMVDCPS